MKKIFFTKCAKKMYADRLGEPWGAEREGRRPERGRRATGPERRHGSHGMQAMRPARKGAGVSPGNR